MKVRLLAVTVALGLLPATAVLAVDAVEPQLAAPPEVPRAQCSPEDRPEPQGQLQGQVTAAERATGFAGRSCNLRLQGQYAGPGGTYVGAAFGDCAYYATAGSGVHVVDLKDPRRPRLTVKLTSRAMLRTWESLKVNKTRSLLAATEYSGDGMDVYDIRDCRRPKLLSSIRIPGAIGHEGEWAPDGRTYYVTNRQNGDLPDFGFLPVDTRDPRKPVVGKRWDTPGMGQAHGLSLSADGNRMYLTVPDGFIGANRRKGSGLLVLDVSGVQRHLRTPVVRVVGNARWQDGGESQMTIPVVIGGRPHLIANDEWGTYQLDFGRLGCAGSASGDAPYGYPRLFDLADERRAKQINVVRLQVQMPANCNLVVADPPGHLFSYSTHYCSVDRSVEPRLLGCGNFESGLRIFDIRKPRTPREVAYYNPPARNGTSSEKSALGVRDVDWASSPPVFRLDRGEVWVQFQDNGVNVLRLDDRVLRGLR